MNKVGQTSGTEVGQLKTESPTGILSPTGLEV